MSYFRETVKGISWIGGLRIALRGITFVKTIIIARILNPAQFGTFGVASLVLTFVETITETGINTILIQEDNIDEFKPTARVISVLRGLIISIVIFLSAGFISNFFHSPESKDLIFMIGFVPLIRGFINPSIIHFKKDLKFHKEFFYRSSIFLVESTVSAILVIIFKDPLALVWGLIVSAIYEVVVSYILASPKLALAYNHEVAKKIVSRGKWITLSGIFDYAFYYGDNIVVGRTLGTHALGIYDMAYRFSLLPITEISDVVAQVTFPVFTKISHDSRRLMKAYIKSTSVIACITIPFGLILILFPTQLVNLILGEKWIEVAGVLRILAVFGIIRSLTNPCGAVFYSLKKQNYVTIITFVGAATLLITILPLIKEFGLNGAAMAAVVASIAQVPFVIYLLRKSFKS